MYKKALALIVILVVSCSFAAVCPAAGDTPEEELMKLRQKLLELVQRIDKLQADQTAEIQALKKQIAEARDATGLNAQQTDRPDRQDDLEALRQAAEAEADKEAAPSKSLGETTFKSGNLGLQALNPEISVTGDMLGTYRSGDAVKQDWDTNYRGLGIHMEAYLDPYSHFKAAVPVNAEGAELGEAYFTRYGVLGNINLTLGKFRQQFGVVNRWHKHALDWFDFPLPLQQLFGPGGLNQVGASIDWIGQLGSLSQEIIFQAADGENGRLFAGNSKNRPSLLAHYKIYHDLSASTYIELGGTGLIGWNDTWSTTGSDVEESLSSQVYGADFTIAWEPTDRMRYRHLEWRTEFYYMNKEIFAPDSSGNDKLNPWGVYTSLQLKVSRTIDLGTRLDYYQPDTKYYAGLTGLSLFPLAVTADDANRYRLGAFVTWSQSPFVKFRAGYAYEDGNEMGVAEHSATLQVVFAAGPHKHERY